MVGLKDVVLAVLTTNATLSHTSVPWKHVLFELNINTVETGTSTRYTDGKYLVRGNSTALLMNAIVRKHTEKGLQGRMVLKGI